jgi:Zn-dependent peptidase ImmA (M78 family)
VRKSNDTIEQHAIDFLRQYNPNEQIPVPIETIVEIELGLNIVPINGLLSLEQIDAFLSHDLKTIYIDEDSYMSQATRCRFTLAHEIGHFCMHKNIISGIQTMEQWKKHVLGAGTGRAIYETEANTFAGYLLMPTKNLVDAYAEAKRKAIAAFEKLNMAAPKDDKIIPYAATFIATQFEVSDQAAQIRLERALRSNLL